MTGLVEHIAGPLYEDALVVAELALVDEHTIVPLRCWEAMPGCELGELTVDMNLEVPFPQEDESCGDTMLTCIASHLLDDTRRKDVGLDEWDVVGIQRSQKITVKWVGRAVVISVVHDRGRGPERRNDVVCHGVGGCDGFNIDPSVGF